MANFIQVAKQAEVPAGEGKTIEAGGQTLALFNVEGTFYAIENTCAHRGGPLGEGSLEEKMITCPWHAWRFDVTTGVSEVSPDTKVACFPVELRGDDIYVDLPAN